MTASATVHRLARSSEQFNEHDFAAYWHGNVEWEKKNIQSDLETYSQDKDIAPKAETSSTTRGISFGETVCQSRVFFTTANGAMGIGPETMLPNDRICVLLGSVTPFILRTEDDHFLLVGECFSSGLMRGEAIAAMNAGICRERVFELR